MSWLRVYNDKNPDAIVWESRDQVSIATKLHALGVRFEQWQATVILAPDASDEDVLKAYRPDIDRLMKEKGYQAVDIIRVLPNNPKIPEIRQKFLNEHTHAEDEVRFFVEGSGMFYLHVGANVYVVLCERGDLIGVPDRTTHWFDTGAAPNITAIRLFTNPAGWVAQYTGEPIAAAFPKYEGHAATGKAA